MTGENANQIDDKFVFTVYWEATKDVIKETLEKLGIPFVYKFEEEIESEEGEFQNFLEVVAEFFDAEMICDRRSGSVSHFAENDFLTLGIDNSGDKPCIFAKSKRYSDGPDEVEYEIGGRVKQTFDKLINEYGDEAFSYPTSGYTSRQLTTKFGY